MDDELTGAGLFEVECPCCGATIEIDAGSRLIVGHRKPVPRSVAPPDLREAVERLRSEESTRDERFRKQVEVERAHGKTLEKRFDGLLKKARSEGPVTRPPRDFDLD
jgi:hypothetical protein